MIKLICLDVDGTLVGASGVILPTVAEAIARARDAGIRLAVCSGRPGFGVTRDIAALVQPDGWHCFQNGASIVSLASGRSLSFTLDPQAVDLLVRRAHETGWPLELYTDDEYAVEQDTERVRRHAGLLGVPFAPRSLDSLTAPIVRGQWVLSHEEGDAALGHAYPALEVSPSLAPSMPDTRFISLTRAGVNKGAAVRAIAAELEIALAEVMYVGDGFNDTPALEIVGLPVAMANAEPEARALARHIVPSVDEGGVAEAIAAALDVVARA